MLAGIQHFLEIVNTNWTTIIVIIGLGIGVYQKAKSYFSKSNEEKIEIAKSQIRETALIFITKAEVDYESWNKAGSIKRAQVIQEIFKEYPILTTVTDQNTIISYIDEAINSALKTLREVIANNKTDLEVTESVPSK